MKLISIENREFLGDYIDAQNSEMFPEGLLCSGLLLSGTLLVCFCLAAGMVTFVTIACVVILGSVLGILKYHGPDTIQSCISGISLTPTNKQPLPTGA